MQILALTAAALLQTTLADADEILTFEIPFKGPAQVDALLERGLDVLAITRDHRLHVAATRGDLNVLSRFGVTPRLLGPPPGLSRIAALDENLGAYRTYSEALSVISTLQSTYPSICSYASIGTSIEGREIYAMKLSDNVVLDEDEPEVLIMGCHHARELMSVELPLEFAEHLLSNYGSDPDVTQMLDEREIWIVPIVNPDGYVYVQNNHGGNSGSWWRKNRRNNGGGSYGVDLNRNYDFNWGYDDIGSSPNPGSSTYRGVAGFSEPETAAIRDLCNNRQFVMALSYHSYGELLLYPWGYDYAYTTDHEIFRKLGEQLGASNGYLVGNTAEGAIYRTNGDFDDWAYGETVTKPAIFSFTPEVGSYAEGGFAPPESLIGPYVGLLRPMNMRFLELAGDPYQVLGPLPPAFESVSTTAASELVLTWSGNLPQDTNPAVSYQLEGLKNPAFVPVVDAEETSPYVALEGFSSDETRAFEGLRSYYSGQSDNLSATLTTVVPYAVSASTDSFGCWMWFDIEEHWDYAYLEISQDEGVIWQSIAGNVTTNDSPYGSNRGNGITGSSGGWTFARFPLTDYIGQEVLLRLHYVTDGAVLGEGLYVDGLGPIPGFEERATIATGILGTSHTFVPGEPASYSYRVRGVDAEGDWSRWSPSLVVNGNDPTNVLVLPPRASSLGQNHPNPFNPSTLLPYVVGSPDGSSKARKVELVIFDATGRRVTTLVDGMQRPGHHRVQWQGRRDDGGVAASGSYFVRLRVDGEKVPSRRVVLLR